MAMENNQTSDNRKKDIFGFNDDFSYINSVDDLDAEIARVRAQIQVDDRQIRESVKLIPREAVRATAGSVLPFFLKAKTADSAVNIIQTVASFLIANPFKKGNKSSNRAFADLAKQVGFFAVTAGIKKFFANRKKKKEEMAERQEAPVRDKVD